MKNIFYLQNNIFVSVTNEHQGKFVICKADKKTFGKYFYSKHRIKNSEVDLLSRSYQ
jgi:hypothetical protein